MTKEQMEFLLNEMIEEFGCTLIEFFGNCLFGLWDNESFGGKRPGVDSDWRYIVVKKISEYDPTVCILGENGEIGEIFWKNADVIYRELIDYALGLK